MLSLFIVIITVLADQISKYFVVDLLKPIHQTQLIEGVLNFTYVENTGAAFGSFSENRAVFMCFSVLIIAVLSFAVYKFHGKNKLFDVCLGLILGGGVGNMIDRVRLGYVVDFIDFCAFDFWKYVFNIADSAVVVGCILAIVFVLLDKNENLVIQEHKNCRTDPDTEDKDARDN